METKRKMMLHDLTGVYGFGLCAKCMDQYKCDCKPKFVEETVFGSGVGEMKVGDMEEVKEIKDEKKMKSKSKKVKKEKKQRVETEYQKFIKKGSAYLKKMGREMKGSEMIKYLASIWKKHKDLDLSMAELESE